MSVVSYNLITINILDGGNPIGEMPVDISGGINGRTKIHENLIITNNNMEPKETIPTLNLYQPVKNRPVTSTTKLETAKLDNNNQESNKQESNIKETYSSTKNRELTANLNNNPNMKKIHLFEFIPKSHTNTIEYYLNNILKNHKSNIPPLTNQVNSSLFRPLPKNSNNFLNVNNNVNLKNSGIGNAIASSIQEEEEPPFNVQEHPFPASDEENIAKILRLNDYFQDQTQNIINLIINEIIYITIPKEKTIYDLNDLSNFYYIIKKGKVCLTRNKEISKNTHGKENIEQNIEEVNNEKITKTLGPWEAFGELSFFNGQKRDEVVIAEENVEVYLMDSESCRELLKRNNEMILKEKYNFLNNIPIFESLDKISKYNVAQKLKKKEFEQNMKIISRGEVGDKLYIIKEGIVSCKLGVKEIRKLSNNDYFGENTLLIEQKRGADVITLQKCICYELSKDDLKEALSGDFIDVILFCFFTYCINNNTYMKKIIIESLIHSIFRCFTLKQYIKKEPICSSKSPDESKRNKKRLIIVVSGSIYSNGKMLYQKGNIIGEEIFQDYNNRNISDEFIAYPDCISLEATIDDLARVMKIDINKEKPYNILRYINKLKKSYLFKNLSENTLEAIAKNMKKEKFNKGDVIIQEGTYGNTFYLISKGKVNITKEGKSLRVLDAGECLGEKSLLSNDSLRTASAIAEDKVICYVIYKKEFDMILKDDNTREYLLKKLALQNTDIQLSDLYYIKFLGKGKFGSVSLVHNSQNLYAIKAISIKMVEKEKMLWKYFVNERNIMLSLDHPFIVKMVKSLRNSKYCFILMEFVNQKNLDEYLSKKRTKRNIYETQFYIGSILLMLDYLQKKYIAHRDIKPSNIMIDANGYLKMIDFGTAKILKDYTSTIIGTPHYIAPEILQGKGYSLSCDFWSLGICMYEIFYGTYPFGNSANEVIDIYKEVLKKNLGFPKDSNRYGKVNEFISELLSKKVNERVCNVSKLKQKSFFEKFEFNKLNDFQLEPPYKPEKKDMSKYFQETKTYESIFKDEKDISYSPGRKKKNKEEDDDSDYDPNWVEVF